MLTGVDDWLREFPKAGVLVYGGLRPALLDDVDAAAGDPFGLVFPPEASQLGAPLLQVGLEMSPPGGKAFELRVLSEAPIWMRGAGCASGPVGEPEADHNLTQFGRLTSSLLEATPYPPTWAGLVLDDRTLSDELERVRAQLPIHVDVC